jgi:hypothetical protein
MAEPEDISRRIGLDYLFEKQGSQDQPSQARPEAAPRSTQADLRDKLHAYAAERVLIATHDLLQGRSSGEEGVRLHEVGDRTGMDAELLLPLSRELESRGLLRTLESTTFGDNLVSITARARELIAAGNRAELMRELEA